MKKIFVIFIILFTIKGFGQQISGRLSWTGDKEAIGTGSQKNFHLPSTAKYVPSKFVVCSGPHLISINVDYSIVKNDRSIKWIVNHSSFEDNNTLYYNYNSAKAIPLSDFGMGSRVSLSVRAKLRFSANGKSHELTLPLNKGSQNEIGNYCELLGICDQLGAINVKIVKVEYILENLSEMVNAFKPYFIQNIYKAPVQQSTEQQNDNNNNSSNSSNINSTQNSNSISQSQYGENTGSNTQYLNQNNSSTQNQITSNQYVSQEEYYQNQKRLSEEKYEAEKNRIYNDAQNEIELINTQYEQRQRLLDEGLNEFAQGIASGDRYERTGMVMSGAVATFIAMDVDPYAALGGALVIGAISAFSKTSEEKEAERLALENERLLNEFQTIVKIADKKLLEAEQKDQYDYQLYNSARTEYEKITTNKFAGSYPSDMINKIDYLAETERIKNVMIDFANDFNSELNKKYLSETSDAIYFYFATIQIDPTIRVSYLKTSNIFPVYYNKATNSWPFLPEIKNKIYSKNKKAIIKGYYKTKSEAVRSKNKYINLAKNNYYQINNDYYKFTFNDQNDLVGNNTNTDFWGNERNETQQKVAKDSIVKQENTDFWGNPTENKQTKTSVKKETKKKKTEETDFWGNPIKK